MNTVYLNGKYLPQQEAHVSVMDRGFLFGDGVYEVLPVYNGQIFRFEQHINRLNRSLEGIRLSVTQSLEDWHVLLTTLLQENSQYGGNQSIYLQVTRGTAMQRNHAFPPSIEPTIFVMTSPLKTVPLEQLRQGMKVITLTDTRWQLCHIKSIALLANVLLYQEALDQQCAEAILIKDGFAVEGATSNIFIVKNTIIKTPPLSSDILGGVTRDLILQLAEQHSMPFEETSISEQELLNAEEVWITSSTREIYPIIRVNNTEVSTGKPGPVWQQMIAHYHNFIKNI